MNYILWTMDCGLLTVDYYLPVFEITLCYIFDLTRSVQTAGIRIVVYRTLSTTTYEKIFIDLQYPNIACYYSFPCKLLCLFAMED